MTVQTEGKASRSILMDVMRANFGVLFLVMFEAWEWIDGNGITICCGSGTRLSITSLAFVKDRALLYSSVYITLALISIKSLFNLQITISIFCLSKICIYSTTSPAIHCHQLHFNHGTTTINPNHQTIHQDPFLPSISSPTGIHPATSFLRRFLLRRWRRRSQRREPIRPRLQPLGRPRTPRTPSPSSWSRHRRWTHKEGSRRP